MSSNCSSDIARSCPTVTTPLRRSAFNHRCRRTDRANTSLAALADSRIARCSRTRLVSRTPALRCLPGRASARRHRRKQPLGDEGSRSDARPHPQRPAVLRSSASRGVEPVAGRQPVDPGRTGVGPSWRSGECPRPPFMNLRRQQVVPTPRVDPDRVPLGAQRIQFGSGTHRVTTVRGGPRCGRST